MRRRRGGGASLQKGHVRRVGAERRHQLLCARARDVQDLEVIGHAGDGDGVGRDLAGGDERIALLLEPREVVQRVVARADEVVVGAVPTGRPCAGESSGVGAPTAAIKQMVAITAPAVS